MAWNEPDNNDGKKSENEDPWGSKRPGGGNDQGGGYGGGDQGGYSSGNTSGGSAGGGRSDMDDEIPF